jgi:hypothetical protein
LRGRCEWEVKGQWSTVKSGTPMRLFIILMVLMMRIAGEALLAADFTLIEALPKRITAVRAKAQKGWDSGVTSEMRKASYDYANALKGMIAELGKTYYPEGYLTKEKLEEYVTAVYAVARFEQDVENVSGEAQGTIAPLEVQDNVCTELATMVATMVEAVAGENEKFDLKQWKKKWEKAVK